MLDQFYVEVPSVRLGRSSPEEKADKIHSSPLVVTGEWKCSVDPSNSLRNGVQRFCEDSQ